MRDRKSVFFEDICPQVFPALITAAILYIASSINLLNERMAVVIEKITSHERRIEMLEKGPHYP